MILVGRSPVNRTPHVNSYQSFIEALSMTSPTDNSTPRPRFIAGAVCPSCKAEDRIVVDLESDERRCVACGFSEARPELGSETELATRVTRGKSRLVETKAEPIRLFDPDNKG